jgi:hypothetical protein
VASVAAVASVWACRSELGLPSELALVWPMALQKGLLSVSVWLLELALASELALPH